MSVDVHTGAVNLPVTSRRFAYLALTTLISSLALLLSRSGWYWSGADVPSTCTDHGFPLASPLKYCGQALLRGRRIRMEDRAVTAQLQLPQSTQSMSFLAVYDGHDGVAACQFLAENLLLETFSRLSAVFRQEHAQAPHQLLPSVLNAALRDVDRNFTEVATESGLSDGATVVAALLLDNAFSVANLGNSRAVLCKLQETEQADGDGGSQGSQGLFAHQLTWEHVPSHPQERARILAAGGKVLARSGGRLRLQGDLEVSRSVGDIYYRQFGLSAEPDVSPARPIAEDDMFLVLASDGLFEAMSPQDVCEHAWAVATGSPIPAPTPRPPPPIPLGPAISSTPGLPTAPVDTRLSTVAEQVLVGEGSLPAGLHGCCDCLVELGPGGCQPGGVQPPYSLEQSVANRLVEEAYNQGSMDNVAVVVLNLWRHLRSHGPQQALDAPEDHKAGDTASCPAYSSDEVDEEPGVLTSALLHLGALLRCEPGGSAYRLLERLASVPSLPSHRHIHSGLAGMPLAPKALRPSHDERVTGDDLAELYVLDLVHDCVAELSEPDEAPAAALCPVDPPPIKAIQSHEVEQAQQGQLLLDTATALAPPSLRAAPPQPTVALRAPDPEQNLLSPSSSETLPISHQRSPPQTTTTTTASATTPAAVLAQHPALSPSPHDTDSHDLRVAGAPSAALSSAAALATATTTATTTTTTPSSVATTASAAASSHPPAAVPASSGGSCSLLAALAEPPLPSSSLDDLELPAYEQHDIQPMDGSGGGGTSPGRRLAMAGEVHLVQSVSPRAGRRVVSEGLWTLEERFGRGHFGEVWRAARQRPEDVEGAASSAGKGTSSEAEGVFVLKRMMAERGPSVRLSGLREVHFGERLEALRGLAVEDSGPYSHQNSTPSLQHGQNHLVRFVESFETAPAGDLWLVFHDEGESLHGLLYEGLQPHHDPAAMLRGGVPPAGSDGGNSGGESFVMMGPSKWWHHLRSSPGGHDVIRDVVHQLLLALHMLHSNNITHRDVKPENMLLRGARPVAAPGALHMRLIDFGSALDSYTLQHLYGEAGPSEEELTLEYAPPEVLFGRYWQGMTAMKRVWTYDMWSVGVVWLELLMGTPHVFQLNSHTQAILDHKLRMHEKSDGERQLVYLLRGMMEFCIYPPKAPASKRGRKELLTWSCTDDALMQLIRGRDPSGRGLPGTLALRLLMRLLHWDPAARPTALQALSHAFFTQPDAVNASNITCAPMGEPGWC